MSAKSLRRETQKAETRERLKGAARAAFARLGYGPTQIADIVRDAGVAQGTFYVHFPGKEALLDELVADFNASLLGKLASLWQPPAGARSDAPEPSRVVRRLAEVCLDHWEAHRDLVAAFVERVAVRADLGLVRAGITPEARTFLAERLVAAHPGLEARRSRLDLVVQGLLGLWMRIALEHLFGERPSRAATIDVLVDMTLGALARVAEAKEAGR